MKFNRNLDWLKESDEDEIFGDELDDVKGDEEQINEVRYINPDNLDRYNPDEIEEVTTASGEKRYKRKTGAQPSNQTVDKKEEPKEKIKVGARVHINDIKEGNSYVTKEDMDYGPVDEFDGIYDIDELKKKGFVKDNEIVIPAGTPLQYQGAYGGAYTFDTNGEEFDISLDDIDLYEVEKDKKEEPKEKDPYQSYDDTMLRIKNKLKDPALASRLSQQLAYVNISSEAEQLYNAWKNKISEQDFIDLLKGYSHSKDTYYKHFDAFDKNHSK